MKRKIYEMTEEQLEEILEASKPTPVMYLSGGTPMGPSQQENANRAWQKLGDEMGFHWATVQPVCDSPRTVFSAVPKAERTTETEEGDDG